MISVQNRNNLTESEFHIVEIGKYELAIQVRLYDFAIVLSNKVKEDLDGYILYYAVGDDYERIQYVYSLIYTILKQKNEIDLDIFPILASETVWKNDRFMLELQSLLNNPGQNIELIKLPMLMEMRQTILASEGISVAKEVEMLFTPIRVNIKTARLN